MGNQNKYRESQTILRNIFVLNLAVALIKIFYGRSIASASITADGFHSLSDATSNIIAMVGLFFAFRPADRDHPYGHRKYETLTSIAIAIMLFLIGGDLLREGIARWHSPVVPYITFTGFVVMLVTIAVNLVVFLWENRAGYRLNSEILVTDSLHTRSDILVSVSVIGTMFGVIMGLNWLDVIASIVIAGLILKTGVNVLIKASGVLCDRITVDPKLIEQTIMNIPRVRKCHKIRTRGGEDDIHIDLHLLVDQTMPVSEAHELACTVEEKLKDEFPGVSDVLVHIEPTD